MSIIKNRRGGDGVGWKRNVENEHCNKESYKTLRWRLYFAI